ncbi:MAG: type II secretion system inner membrane protein GspF [Deltaproteobacteria bacterium]|nr:type II secretion system inner membrane protein GspF [Deltaproteobacteria bacterium]
MAVYEYKGLDAKGKKVDGIVDAESPKAARQKLRKQGVFTTDIAENASGSAVRRTSEGKGGGLAVEVDFSKYLERVGVGDIAIITRQLSALIGAGIPLVECIATVSRQTEKEKLRIALREIREKVNEGKNLADALEDYPGMFGDLYVNMVRAGEQAGALEHVLERLADYTEASVELRGKVVGSMTYPVIMLMVAMAVITFMMAFVVPKITKIFTDMGQDLPAITKFVMWTSDMVQGYWWLGILLAIAASWGFRRYYATDAGRLRVDGAVLKVPVFGKMLRMVALARFSSTLATLMEAGVPLLRSMGIVRRIMSNRVLRKVIEDAQEAVREGQPMNVPLRKSGHFPPMVVDMISVGERTGDLGPMLNRVAISYESQVSRRLATLTSLLEPMMILLMGGVVFFIAMAVLLPMLQMNALGS